MPDPVIYVDETWTKVVPEGSPEARFGVQLKDAKRMGLVPLEEGERFAQPEILHSANVAPEPADVADAEAKEAPPPADKAVRKRTTK